MDYIGASRNGKEIANNTLGIRSQGLSEEAGDCIASTSVQDYCKRAEDHACIFWDDSQICHLCIMSEEQILYVP